MIGLSASPSTLWRFPLCLPRSRRRRQHVTVLLVLLTICFLSVLPGVSRYHEHENWYPGLEKVAEAARRGVYRGVEFAAEETRHAYYRVQDEAEKLEDLMRERVGWMQKGLVGSTAKHKEQSSSTKSGGSAGFIRADNEIKNEMGSVD